MMERRAVWLVAAVVALAHDAVADTRVDPAGQLWIVTSPAECPGVPGALPDYERSLRARVDETMAQLTRTPRVFHDRASLLRALDDRSLHGWLFLFLSGHGMTPAGLGARASRVCIGDGAGPGEWLDIDRELLPALPPSLSGAVIVLDACSSAHVDPRAARISVAIISASPNAVDTSALFGATVLASLAEARDDNCNGVFDDDDLFAATSHRLSAALSVATLEARPKLRRNAPSPVPLPVRPFVPPRCGELAKLTDQVAPRALPKQFVEQRAAQRALAGGASKLPALDHDLFVIAGSADAGDAQLVRTLAMNARLDELRGDERALAALAATTAFAEIYKLVPALGWLQTWRLRDGLLISAVRLDQASCGLPSRIVRSGVAVELHGRPPRYTQAVRYLREVRGPSPGVATACFEAEGQCFVPPGQPAWGCAP